MNKSLFRGVLVVAALALVSTVGIFAMRSFKDNASQEKNSTFHTDGLQIMDGTTLVKASNAYPALGIMIENELLSRPYQQGLADAKIVYEALTEGGITRFLAIYDGGAYPAKAGPIRSARSHFVDWIQEYGDAPFLHVGGSADALARLAKEVKRNADQFVLENYFKRENTEKVALEHTMFTTKELMEKLVNDKKWYSGSGKTNVLKSHFTLNEDSNLGSMLQTSTFTPLEDNSNPMETNPSTIQSLNKYAAATSVSIPFSTNTYKVAYAWDIPSQKFMRSQANKPHMDSSSGKQLFASTVIVQYVSSISKTIGSGEALIFIGGRAVPAKWSKSSVTGETEFTVDGKRVSFSTGPVWIEVVPKTVKASYK